MITAPSAASVRRLSNVDSRSGVSRSSTTSRRCSFSVTSADRCTRLWVTPVATAATVAVVAGAMIIPFVRYEPDDGPAAMSPAGQYRTADTSRPSQDDRSAAQCLSRTRVAGLVEQHQPSRLADHHVDVLARVEQSAQDGCRVRDPARTGDPDQPRPARGGHGATLGFRPPVRAVIRSAHALTWAPILAIAGYISLGFAADRFGRKGTVFTYFAASLLMTPVLFLWTQDLTPVLLLCAVNGFFTLGQYTWMPVWLPEFYPTTSARPAPRSCSTRPGSSRSSARCSPARSSARSAATA
jgi:hypothetical protein